MLIQHSAASLRPLHRVTRGNEISRTKSQSLTKSELCYPCETLCTLCSIHQRFYWNRFFPPEFSLSPCPPCLRDEKYRFYDNYAFPEISVFLCVSV
jgi:hypothetical protein